MLNLTADNVRDRQVEELVDDFVCLLDRRDGDAWLNLFTEDGYYVVVREKELLQGNNVLIIGEDMKRLRARVISGLERDSRRMVHAISGVRTNADVSHATASFMVWCDGVPTYSGVYLIDLARSDGALRIRECRAVLYGEIVHTAVFLPV